jgi:hypothetical protein
MSEHEHRQHERAWRVARTVGLVLLAAWPVVVVAAVVTFGIRGALVAVPGGPVVVLGVMDVVERALRPTGRGALEHMISAGS